MREKIHLNIQACLARLINWRSQWGFYRINTYLHKGKEPNTELLHPLKVLQKQTQNIITAATTVELVFHG